MLDTSHRRKLRAGAKKWPATLGALLFWLVFLMLVLLVDPARVADFGFHESYLLFFLVLFLALCLTGGIVFCSYRRGLWLALGLVSWLFLRLKELGNFFNFMVIVLLFVSIELFMTSAKHPNRL